MLRKDIKLVYPDQFADYILDSPLLGNVIDVREISFINPDKHNQTNCKKYRVVLDVGKLDGVKPLMIFFGTGKSNNIQCYMIIQDVFDNECAGYIQNCDPHYNCSLEKQFSTKKMKVQ